jgi:hypothetical protein
MTADFISRMVTISSTAEAFAAIEATLPKGTKGEPRLDGKGGLFFTLPDDVLNLSFFYVS